MTDCGGRPVEAGVPPEIRQATQHKLLASPHFSSSRRLSEFLRLIAAPRADESAAPPSAATRRTPLRLTLAVTPTAVTTTGALVPLSRRTGDARNSIAVLPFTNAGGLPEKDYFSDWLTEQIAGELSRSGKLQVAARGSARRFKDSRDLRRIGEQLRVDLVLAGGVRFDGDSIGISTRLYDPTTAARSGRANSTGPPRKSRSCVMRLQQLSRDRCTWGTRFPRERAGAGWTQDSGALDFYLQARYLFNSRKPENLRKSVQFYNAALKRDPKFARGYAGVAEDYVVLAANEDQDMQGGGR